MGLKRVIETQQGQTHVDITVENVSWGVYFKLWAFYKDGSGIGTDIYTTNSYIAPKDLEALLNQSGIEEVDGGDVYITVSNRVLTFRSSVSVPLTVYDFQGSLLYCDESDGSRSIPVNAHFIIVQYQWGGKTVTKKIRVK